MLINLGPLPKRTVRDTVVPNFEGESDRFVESVIVQQVNHLTLRIDVVSKLGVHLGGSSMGCCLLAAIAAKDCPIQPLVLRFLGGVSTAHKLIEMNPEGKECPDYE